MKIVSFRICPFVQRVIGVLELKKVEYEVEYISLADKPDWFIKASPHGQVPILVTDDGVLFESEPIAEYIDEAYEDFQLHPSEPFQKAQNRAWITLAARNYLVQCRTQRSATVSELKDNQSIFSQAFEKIERALRGEPYFNGRLISQVDVAWFVILFRAHIVYQCTGYDFLAAFPKVAEWKNTLLAVEGLRHSAPDGFIEEFCNFYINEATYLGSLMKSNAGRCGQEAAACCDANTLTTCCH
jgi:glutathione S-transferase